jgi:CSLREA domain-containing protein
LATVVALVALTTTLVLAATAGAAPLVVTKAADTNDGKCNGDCSLREAIGRANKAHGADTITLKAKSYNLTIEGSDENRNDEGDLDVRDDLTIKGKSPGKTTIQGAWSGAPDRLLDLEGGHVKLSVSGVALTNGQAGFFNGGAISVPAVSDSLKLTNARVIGNTASFSGGIESYGKAKISKTLFANNFAMSCCGAFYNYGEATLTNVIFDNNTAGADTGAMYDQGESAVLRNVTFLDNNAGSVGGAFISSALGTKLTNVTFSGNESSGDGGAFYGETGSASVLSNVTITNNGTESDGGGFYASSSSITINNSIVAGNGNLGGTSPDCGGAPFHSDGYLLIGDETGCTHVGSPTGLINGNPMLEPLADNGGFTPTHALQGTSPAKNAGNPASPGSNPACAKTDQRGVKRPQHGRCDLGAYELK